LSGWTGVRHGVPQGSILGPLLFLLYVNDLPNNIKHISVQILYADDTSILFSHSNLNDLTNTINNTLKILNNWFTANYLSLNISKTHFIYFTSKVNTTVELNIHYDKYIMPTNYYTKFLGVTIDCMLIWSNNIESLANKLNSVCYLIRNLKPYVSIPNIIMIYHSLFNSIRSFGIIFWGNSHYSTKFLKYERGYLGSLRDVKVVCPAEVYLKNSIYFHFYLIIFFLY
jgi:hypothetical protein